MHFSLRDITYSLHPLFFCYLLVANVAEMKTGLHMSDIHSLATLPDFLFFFLET